MSIISNVLISALATTSLTGRIDVCFKGEGKDVIVMPIVTNPSPEISNPQKNEVFNAVTGDLKIIGALGLRSLSVESIWPTTKNYSFSRFYGSSGVECIQFFNKYRKAYKIIRCIIVYANGQDVLNMPCVIDEFAYKTDKMGDIHYKIAVSEYKEIK